MERGEWELMMIVLNAECDKYKQEHKEKLKKKQLKQFDTVINKQDIEKAFKEVKNDNSTSNKD